MFFEVLLTVHDRVRGLSWHQLCRRTWGLWLIRARARLLECQVDLFVCQAWGSRGNEISLAPFPT